MKRNLQNEAGQSIVIITVVLVILAALAAVVVDAGNSYVQDRKVQNAADAASMAGSLALAQKQSNGSIADTIENYLVRNGIDTSTISAYFVVEDAGGTTHVLNQPGDKSIIPRQWAQDLIPPEKMTYNGVAMKVVGVDVEAKKRFDTFFARSFGITQVDVFGSAKANVKCGVCSSTGVFPVAFDVKKFRQGTDGLPIIDYEQTNPTAAPIALIESYMENGKPVPGNIGYLRWGDDGSAPTLQADMHDTSRSGTVSVNSYVSGSSGDSNSSGVRQEWGELVGGDPIILPVFDDVSGQGTNARYHIVGFASFRVTSVELTGNPKKVFGKFQRWVNPQSTGGCADYGICVIRESPQPPEQKRTLAGSVTFQPVVPNKQPQSTKLSADVVFVMDNSGSMNYAFGGGDNTLKITAAKTAMNLFLDKIQISNTVNLFQHQVGFVKFPQGWSTPNFDTQCEIDWANKKKTGMTYFQDTGSYKYNPMTTRRPLGTSIATVKSDINDLSPNGGTPMALGMVAGREIVLGAGRNPSNVPVIILATDGMPNARSTDGTYSGWNGLLSSSGTNVKPLGVNPDGTTTYPNCNKAAAQDTYDAANAAKSAGVLIFAIGVGATGTDFDPNVIKAIATPNGGGKTYYFTAKDTNALNDAYNSIAKTFTDLGGACSIKQKLPERAAGAVLTIKKPDGSFLPPVVTLANGEFIVKDVPPGKYEITAVSYNDPVTKLPYTVFTDAPGGADIPNPIIIVGDTADTYRTDTYIRTKIDPCQ